MKIMNVYEPVKALEKNGTVSFEISNREYIFTDKSVFPSSIITCGNELLTSPIRIVASVSGQECTFSCADSMLMSGATEESASAVFAMESERFIVNTSHTVEFDGCDIINMTIAPRSITPGSLEVLYGKKWETDFRLDKLFLEIPLCKKHIKYYQAFPFSAENHTTITGKIEHIKNDRFSVSAPIAKGGFDASFKEQIYLFGRQGGIGFFFESDEGWNYSNKNKAIEVLETGDSYVLRFHFLDSEPSVWKKRRESGVNSYELFPISFKFGMMVTPIKPIFDEMQYEKNIHIDCMKRFPQQHDEFLSSPIVEGSNEIGFDRLKRMGVETLYIHEKWNDIQNSYLLTEKTEKRLKYIIAECHKRNIRVIPYFGYELASLSPLFFEKGDRICRVPHNATTRAWSWYRTPAQRDRGVCMSSEWNNMFYEGLKSLIEKYGFDGFYFDGTLVPNDCVNSLHGCGYVDENGETHPTYSVFATREFAKKIYALATERGATVNFHPNGCHSLAVLGFCSSLFEGEIFQSSMMKGELSDIPEGCLQALMDYTSTGVPVQALCYINPPSWSFHEAIGMMLLHNSVPKTVCWEQGLSEMSDIWHVYDSFKTAGVRWIPYYDDECPVLSLTQGVRVSSYEREDMILSIVVTTSRSFDGKATVKSKGKRIRDAVSGELISENGMAEISLKGFDYKLVLIEK